MTPTIALAIEDFVPVLLTLVALSWLSRIVYRLHRPSGYVAGLGALLVVSGGLLKAVGKLAWALAGAPTGWLEDSLFLLMAPGFACLAWAIWSAQRRLRGEQPPRFIWPVPLAILLFTGGGAVYMNGMGAERIWFLVLLTMVVVMSALTLILLSRHAWHYRQKRTAFLFLLYLAFILVLNGLARTPSPTVSVEWTKQLLNTAATIILTIAAWRLLQATNRPLASDRQQQQSIQLTEGIERPPSSLRP